MLDTLIRQQIANEGPMPVADYMALALAHPEHGYYMQRDPFGSAGDFITAPEISQLFGELIGLWCIDGWRLMGEPKNCALVEMGPGRGTLMSDLLRASKMRLKFYEALSLHLIEISPALKAIQARALESVRLPKFWHSGLESFPSKPAIFVANEFFDALPVRQFVRDAGVEKERCITVDAQDNLCFSVQDGDVVREECPAGEAVLRQLCQHIKRNNGIALIVDYGYTEGSSGDTLQAVRDHQYHPVLSMPGEADITAHVDFRRLGDIVKEEGLQCFGPQSQGLFLRLLGGDVLLQKLMASATPKQQQQLLTGYSRLVSEREMGLLFKVIAIAPKGIIQLAGF